VANVASAFSAVRPAGRSAILVDDVLTTGATLRAAAESLSVAGWQHLAAVTFARALRSKRRRARELTRMYELFTEQRSWL